MMFSCRMASKVFLSILSVSEMRSAPALATKLSCIRKRRFFSISSTYILSSYRSMRLPRTAIDATLNRNVFLPVNLDRTKSEFHVAGPVRRIVRAKLS